MISARDPGGLPAPAALRRRCEELARLAELDDPDDVPEHDFDRRAGIFWLRDDTGNHVQISFRRAGVVILGFDHESRMSPANHGERIWPGVVDALPKPLRRALTDYSFGNDITFCIWREAGARRWQSGAVRRPRGRDVDGSARLLAILAATKPKAKPRAPKPGPPPKAAFAIGARVIDPWGSPGKVTAIHDGLAAGAAAGEIRDVDRWLRGLSIRPKTPRRGVWYSVRPDTGGAALIGERDLRRA